MTAPAVERIACGEPIALGGCGVRKRLSAARRFLDWHGLRAVDVGCGNGAYTATIAEQAFFTVGVDIDRRWLAASLGRAQTVTAPIRVAQSTAEHLPLADASFDVAFCIETLEHVRNE